MLETAVVEQVQQLLAAGLSQREAARKVGVSRGSVHAIATGKRTLRENPSRDADEAELVTPRGPWQRCPQCGGRVMMPCLACQIRQFRERPIDRRRSANVRNDFAGSAAGSQTSPLPLPASRDHPGNSVWNSREYKIATDGTRMEHGKDGRT